VLIQNGVVYDGSGGPGLRAAVVIDDGRIVHVGKVAENVHAKRTVDATGMAVTPGFIDTHSHGDPASENTNFLKMGVTTICLGQDGQSPSGDRIKTWAKRNRRKKLRVNSAPFVGHGTVRSLAKVGLKRDELSEKQLERMARIVGEEMDAGAWGLTTGLEYRPGALAKTEELVAIAKPVAARDGVVMSHMRSEDDDTIEAALDELLAQGSEGGARVHVSHIKVVYGKGAKRAEELLAKLQRARDAGVKVTADLYPYNASYTTISIVFPDWAKPPASYAKVKRKRRDELLSYLRKKVTRRGGPQATLFGSGSLAGLTLKEVAEKKGKPFEEVLAFDIGPGGASAAYFVMDDALQSRLLLDEHVMISTDGGYSSSHPRGYGAFAKVVAEHVVKRKALPLREAVRKMTSLPAETVRLTEIERGRLQKGWAADVLVFDPDQVEDRANYEKPRKYAAGMQWVFVNGRAAIEAGKLKKRYAGKLLLRPSTK
jgi:N-acyl-D-aspartate/D-glutamate deacylase